MYAMHVCIDDDDDDDDVSSTRMHTNLYVRQGGYVSCLFLSITMITYKVVERILMIFGGSVCEISNS